MGTTYSAYFFPSQNQSLEGSGLLKTMQKHQIDWGPDISKLTLIEEEDLDEDNQIKKIEYLMSFADDFILPDNFMETVRNFIENNTNFYMSYITNRDYYLDGNLGFEGYPPKDKWNSHFWLSWEAYAHRKNNHKNKFFIFLKELAKACNASYVLLAEERSDPFSDIFLENEEGIRTINTKMLNRPWPDTIFEIWVDYSNGGRLPVGMPLIESEKCSDGFVRYHLDYGGLKPYYTCAMCEQIIQSHIHKN